MTTSNVRFFGAGTLDNSNNTIRGQGALGSNAIAINNAGTIAADVAAATLTLDANSVGGFNNSGFVRADNGGILDLSGTVATNTGTFLAANGSTISLSSSTISGGTIATLGSGVVESAASGNGTLINVTNSGHYVVRNFSNLNLTGTINNLGSISISSTGSLSDIELTGGSTITLTGGGLVNMATATGRFQGSGTLDNVNNTIHGQGSIGSNGIAVNNAGTISADIAAATLTIDVSSGGMTNSGRVLSENGGVLVLSGSPVTNTGTFHASNGSTISLASSTISGGTISTSGTGIIETAASGNGTLVNLTNAGHYIVQNFGNAFVTGTINNTGSFTVNSTASATDFELVGGSTVTLTGGGTIHLTGVNPRLLGTGTLHNLNNTIRGLGAVGLNGIALINDGVIVADVNAATLTIDTNVDAMSNSGIVRAENGGIISLSGTMIANSGTFAALNGSTISLLSCTISGGTLTTTGSGVIQSAAGGNGTLINVTNTGAYVGQNFSNIFLSGLITNTGSISINPAGSVTDLQTVGLSTVTLSGGGSVNLNGGSARLFGTATLVTSNVIRGVGFVGLNSLPIINSGTIEATPFGADTQLTIDPPAAGLVNTGTLLASPGAQLVLSAGTFTGGGSIVVAAGGSLNTQGSVQVEAGQITLDGLWTHAGTRVNASRIRGSGSLSITSGTVSISTNGGSLGTSRLASLSTDGSGRLDLSDNDLVIDYTGATPLATVRTMLLSAYVNGAWSGPGLTSSTAGATTNPKTGLGYLDNTLGGLTVFSGQSIDDTTVVIKYTYAGDTDLDGDVDVGDLGTLASNWQTAGLWVSGDFDYNGSIDVNDLGLLASNWQAGVGSPLGTSLAEAVSSLGLPAAAVPEPGSSLGVLLVGVLAARRRPPSP
jgi:hypothetical protein